MRDSASKPPGDDLVKGAGVSGTPIAEDGKRLREAQAKRTQRIFDLGGHLAVVEPFDDAIRHQLFELLENRPRSSSPPLYESS